MKMRSLRRWGVVSATVATVAALALSGCSTTPTPGSNSSDAAQGATIGALYLDAQGFFGGVKKGIEAGSADAGIRLLGQNSGGDATKEAQFMSTLIAGGAQAILISPVSGTASVPVIKQAYDAGIPVICYNGCIADADAEKYVYALVTTSQEELGGEAGKAAGEWLVEQGLTEPKFGIINCDMYEACIPRKEGFKAAVEKLVPGVQWVADQSAVDPDKTTSVATNELTANPDLDAIYATTENGTVGAIQAVINTDHRGKTVVFGIDMSQQIANYLVSDPDVLILTNGQDPQAMGKLAVEQALAAIRGEKPAQFKITTPTTIFKSSDQGGVKEWLTTHADGIP